MFFNIRPDMEQSGNLQELEGDAFIPNPDFQALLSALGSTPIVHGVPTCQLEFDCAVQRTRLALELLSVNCLREREQRQVKIWNS